MKKCKKHNQKYLYNCYECQKQLEIPTTKSGDY
jgi:hypothetical protein